MSKITKTKSTLAVAHRLAGMGKAQVKLFEAYRNLHITGRKLTQKVLLRHAFVLGGRDSYIHHGRWNEIERWASWKLLCENASEEMAEAWHDWAFEISMIAASETQRRDAIVWVVSQFVIFDWVEEPVADESKV
jgi:hypothetical protein